VPDILSRIKPIFRSLVRGREREPRVAELKPWVRVVVTAYLVTLVPALLFLFAWMIVATPRLIATLHDSFGQQLDRIDDSAGIAEVAVGALRIVALALPLAAMSLSVSRIGRMAGGGLVRWSRGSVPRTAVAGLGAAALVGAAGYIWWPNGDYEPIRPGERGTIGESLDAMRDAAGGHPFFTSQRELTYGSVPTKREGEPAERAHVRGEVPARKEAPDRVARPGERDAPAGADGRYGGGLERSVRPDRTRWPQGSELDGSDYLRDGRGDFQPGPSEPPTEPGTTTTQPTPTTTTTQPAPSDTEPTTVTEPALMGTDGTGAAPTDTPPTTTETTPTTTETAPAPTDTTPTTTESTAPANVGTSTTVAPTTEIDPTTTTSPSP
jgi:hypothetical protein